MATVGDYEAWEVIIIAISILLALVYNLRFRSSAIGEFQGLVGPVWAAIHQQRKSTMSINAIQNLRNIMTISTLLAAAMLSCAVMAARFGADTSIAIEMMVVTFLCSAAFINFAFCSNITHYLIFNVALYPEDKTDLKQIPREVVERGWERSNRQMRFLQRHLGWGKKFLFLALPSFFIAMHPVALLVATVASCYVWYYVDRHFGMELGGVRVDDVEAEMQVVQQQQQQQNATSAAEAVVANSTAATGGR